MALALLVTRASINVMSMISIIMLMGFVANIGILLIDFMNKEREGGNDCTKVILTSARVRLRLIISR